MINYLFKHKLDAKKKKIIPHELFDTYTIVVFALILINKTAIFMTGRSFTACRIVNIPLITTCDRLVLYRHDIMYFEFRSSCCLLENGYHLFMCEVLWYWYMMIGHD